ncbi:PEP-CTERM sorting domain-containing protein [Marinobacter nanhaiticus D15-8W]|uniref:PEP-CTERM sorting domain-containing protein n=1 Tax=Marinobacter nanhaiticus D15-8W TaxID=626887 RepID=N6VZB1_9GAMM|nr:THxN family PEP-CTERM protein [Marinobacter nanhaiticus]ENO15625.2 PEP-CTERM sorting domain-containing protein [Marinobacter nanhaiticus D15-8W]
MKIIKSCVSAVAASIFSVGALAFPVDLDSVSGQWINASGGMYVSGEGTNQIRWGAGQKQSGYDFVGNSSLPQSITDSSPFILGEFTHRNHPIGEYSAIDSVELDIYASFSNDDGSVATGPFTFLFDHNETENNAAVTQHCGNWDFICYFLSALYGNKGSYTTHDGPVDDIVKVIFDTSVESSEFTLGNSIYSLSLLGFEGNANELDTAENEMTSINLIASLNVRSVPEPGTVALLGMGLLGMGLVRRRSKA